jgi:glucose/arabinose dehydrogenase
MRYGAAGLGAVALACLLQASAQAADVAAGKQLFTQQCLLCHSADTGDGGGAQGPSLGGVVGRPAASYASFSYTDAMKKSGLVWNEATLDRFLEAPTKVAPGTAMVIAVPGDADRANLIAYLGTTHAIASASPPSPAAAVSEDWRNDAPGRRHRIDPSALPPPFATPGAANFPRVVAKPAAAKLSVPAGFKVDVFTSDVKGPRRMVQAPNGDIFVSENKEGRIKILHQSTDGERVGKIDVYMDDLNLPYGLAFYPTMGAPSWLYVALGDKVVRFPYKTGDFKALGKPEVVVPSLPSGGGHITRDIAFSPDGSKLFVSVGSASNVAEGMTKKTLEEAAAYAKEHVLGATWGNEEHRADVLVYGVSGDGKTQGDGKIFATGVRNCVRLTVQPGAGDLWCTTNERDMLGDDLVPDYSTRVQEGHYYGWPWYYFGDHEDPRRKGERPDLAGKATIPDVPIQAHSAAVDFAFYTATPGASAFPAEYVGDAFAALHGSWNRGPRTGAKVVRVLFKDGKPTGEYEDFLTGFIVDNGSVWGRPAGLLELTDGSLLVGDDAGNVIYRISHTK